MASCLREDSRPVRPYLSLTFQSWLHRIWPRLYELLLINLIFTFSLSSLFASIFQSNRNVTSRGTINAGVSVTEKRNLGSILSLHSEIHGKHQQNIDPFKTKQKISNMGFENSVLGNTRNCSKKKQMLRLCNINVITSRALLCFVLIGLLSMTGVLGEGRLIIEPEGENHTQPAEQGFALFCKAGPGEGDYANFRWIGPQVRKSHTL